MCLTFHVLVVVSRKIMKAQHLHKKASRSRSINHNDDSSFWRCPFFSDKAAKFTCRKSFSSSPDDRNNKATNAVDYIRTAWSTWELAAAGKKSSKEQQKNVRRAVDVEPFLIFFLNLSTFLT